MQTAYVQGLLTGPSLSPVQVYAASMLDLERRRDAAKTKTDALRNALVAADLRMFDRVYPEYAPAEDEDPPPAPVPTEVERAELEAWLREHMSGEMTGADLGGDEGWQ